MYLGPTSEQLELRAALREVLSEACPAGVVRAAWDGAATHPYRELWRLLGDIGLLGVLAPLERNGLGGTEMDLVLLLEECGRFAVPGPLLEHVAVGVPVLTEADRDEGIAAAGGSVIATAGSRGSRSMPFADDADLCISIAADGVALSPRSEFDIGDQLATVDHSVRTFDVTFRSSEPLHVASVSKIRDRAALAASALLLGLADHLIQATVEYVKTRKQFNVAIGSQQAIKHHLATALVALVHARPAVYRAAHALAEGEAEGARDVSFAKVYASRAAHLASRTALQCHGAIGYSWEHDLHLWMKRVWILTPAWGTVSFHEARVADAVIGKVT
jgi:alkylation response protein AidB-like acyl-CoA dehydrogenase